MLALVAAALLAAPQSCPAKPVAPPKALSGWTKRAPLTAALTPAALGQATLPVGRAADVALAPVGTLRWAADPAKKPPEDSRGGLIALTVAKAGTYRVALGAGAWIDVVQGDRPVASTAHGHGPACTGIAKMVDFPLQPGRYVLQLSGAAEQRMTVLVAQVG